MSKSLKPRLNTTFGGLVDRTSYTAILVYILLTIFLFALLFYVLDTFFQGNGTNKADLNILDYVYFSVVTFATLGYGDIAPLGLGKLLVIFEVLSGLFLAAIFIGKISSERQATKLKLIYSSINHQRILKLIDDISEAEEEMQVFYAAHDNKNLLTKAKSTYDLVSVIRKYLTLQSLEGELASYGNSSTLKRLYVALAKLQKLHSTINKTIGVPANIVTVAKRTIVSIGEIGNSMKQFHVEESKTLGNLNELVLEVERYSAGESAGPVIYRTEVTEELRDLINGYKKRFPDLKG